MVGRDESIRHTRLTGTKGIVGKQENLPEYHLYEICPKKEPAKEAMQTNSVKVHYHKKLTNV